MRKHTKILIAAVATLVAVLGFTSVAYGANGSAPGDHLYGLDRALERVGIGNGGLKERLAEAGDLLDEGQVDEGLAHAVQALAEEQEEGEGEGDEPGDEESAGRQEALMAAAEAVLSHGSEQSLEVRTRVAEKLRWMATTELTGKEYGQAVSALARGLSLEEGESSLGEEGTTDTTLNKGQAKKAERPEKTNNGKALGHSRSGTESEPEPE